MWPWKSHALDCWYRFDEGYVPQEKSASAAVNSYGVDTNWYTDTGAIDHVTGDLNRLVIHNKYNGNDQIKTASGSGMDIKHIGYASVATPSKTIHLNNVLHVPKAAKNLVSVHRLTTDNHAYLEFHPDSFFIKD